MIPFISIDPSLANTAVVRGAIDGTTIIIYDAFLVQTEKSSIKTVRASSDLIERCAKLHSTITDYCLLHNPKVIFAETPSGSQSADSMKSYGISCMLLASLHLSPIQVTPTEVKLASVGDKKASKAQMIEWAVQRHPGDYWLKHKGELTAKNEHIADAIAVAYAGIKTNQFKQLIAML